MSDQQLAQAGSIYGAVAHAYLAAGWPCVMPVPAGAKHPPPEGYTGDGGRDTTAEDVNGWCLSTPQSAVALRMPAGVIGIDVDQYVKGGVQKNGAQTLAALEAKWGPLPATWTSTARGSQQPSRIHFFRAPAQRYAGKAGADIEVIQRHHRYVVVWPSPHGEAGGQYRWYDPRGIPAEDRIPRPGELAELPQAWATGLAEGAAAALPAGAREDGWALLSILAEKSDQPPCIEMQNALAAAQAECTTADRGSRHDAMTKHVQSVLMYGAKGHAGCNQALTALQELWGELTAGEGREDEFTNAASGMVFSGARKAVAEHGLSARHDPCLIVGALQWQAPVAAGGGGGGPDEIPVALQPPQLWSPLQIPGLRRPHGGDMDELFDPHAGLDSGLAEQVLARTSPVLRYAPDAGAWLVRGPQYWTAQSGDMAKWAVDLVSRLMPHGDPDAPDGSEAKNQAVRRARFCSHGPSSAIAGKMNAQIAAGHHASTVLMSEMDSEREVLWAGGFPYNLRESKDQPVLVAAQYCPWCRGSREQGPGVPCTACHGTGYINPADTPHLHSAGVAPAQGIRDERPTPLWDAFLNAVWPDRDMQRWALRVLAVAFTGYADKQLPILSGPTNAGKTQIIMLLMSVLGSYSHAADARLLAPADRSHASIVHALMGRRMSFIDEAPRSGQQAAERLKQITGGADLTGNRMHENPITFSPTHTLILTANPEHEPVLADAAIKSRVRLIPCEGDQEAVRAARAAIGALDGPVWRREAPAVLSMMMGLAAAWLHDPSIASNAAAPDISAAAAGLLTDSQDQVLNWLEECEPWEAGTRSRELYKAFTQSCREMSIHPSAIWSETRWGRRLTDLGFDAEHRRDGKYRPLRVKPPSIFPELPAKLSGPVATAAARGSDGSSSHAEPENQTGHETRHNGKTPDQTMHTNGLVTGVTSSSPITRTYARTHTHTQENGGDVSHPSSRHTAPAAEPGVTAVIPAAEEPGWTMTPANPPSGQDSRSVTAEPEEEPPAKPARKTPAKAAKPQKPKPDPALEGAIYQLPVIVARNPEGGAPLVLSCTTEQARAACEPYLGALSVDCETSGFPVSHADYELRLVQLGGEHMAAVLDPSDPAQAAVIADVVARAAVLHAHSASADLVPLAAAGLGDAASMWARMTDSVLIAKLADPALAGSDENQLKKLAQDTLPDGYAVSPPAEAAKNQLFKSGGWLVQTKPLTPREKSGWAMVRKNCETFTRYAGSDVLDLGAVVRVLPPSDPAILDRERKFQAICARVAHTGFRLDRAHIGAKIAEFTAKRDEAQQRVAAACPAITNPSSTTEVPAALLALGVPLGLTKEGNPSAAKGALELMAKQDGKDGRDFYEHAPLLGDILEYRHCVTTLGLLLEPLRILCDRGDGRMRPTVYTINADTGRTSCVRPNGQQFSRQGGIRACVTADEGMAGISADFSGVEIRVGAALSGDMGLLAAELSTRCQACGNDPCDLAGCGKDQKGLHWMAARMAFGAGATKEDRYNSKRIIFSKMFGGGPKSGAEQVGLPVEAGIAVHDAFARIAPGFIDWDQRMRRYVEQGNRAYQAYSGRTIWLPRGRAHAAGNYAIQGTARELLVDGTLKWQATRWGHLPLLPIHDELLTFVAAAEAEAARQALQDCMRNELYGVPIVAASDQPFASWPDSS